MTRYSDNIFSGFNAITSALSSRSAVVLTKSYNFNAATGSSTMNGTFPPGVQNLAAELFITQQGSANTSNKITVSAGGTNMITITSFGSAAGWANQSVTSLATFTVVASACQNIAVPTPSINGGEVPFSVTFLKDAGDNTGSCTIKLTYNRTDSGFPAPGAEAATGF